MKKLERRAVLQIAGALSMSSTVGCAATMDEAPPSESPTEHPHNDSWLEGKIRGYPARPSVKPGEVLTLHVSTHAPAFRVDFYRQGATLELVGSSPWYPGKFAPPRRPDEDWEFPAYEFAVPAGWKTGAYVAFFVEADSQRGVRWHPTQGTAYGDGKAFFVVRNGGTPAKMLYKIAVATFQAYNFAGGANLYKNKDVDDKVTDIFLDGAKKNPPEPNGLCVSMLRPGQGAGGNIMPGGGPLDFYDYGSPMNCFEHLDAYLVRFLESNGYEVDYCTDWDVQVEPGIFQPYQLLICAGHDEYWSEEQRAAHEHFVKTGGNIAFLTGNTCWWRIHYIRDNTALVCNKEGSPAFDQWYRTSPENSLTGVSYRHGGSWWPTKRKPLGFTVQFPEHWVYEGTGLAAGEVFGDGENVAVVGVEVDGCPWERIDGVAVPKDRKKYGTPDTFSILATGEITKEWPVHYGQGAALGIYTYPGGGTVFNVATTDWNRCIPLDPRIERITRNVIERLSKTT